MELYSNLRAGEKGAWLSIGTYIFLSAMKLIVGYLGASAALKADGLNNTTDIIASIAVLIGLRISQNPGSCPSVWTSACGDYCFTYCIIHYDGSGTAGAFYFYTRDVRSRAGNSFHSNRGCCPLQRGHHVCCLSLQPGTG